MDVGCGPGALTARLVELLHLGPEAVTAIDPSGTRLVSPRPGTVSPGWTSTRPIGRAPALLPEDAFDVSIAQLVVHFMADPVAGLREMGRGDPARVASSRPAYGTTPVSAAP